MPGLSRLQPSTTPAVAPCLSYVPEVASPRPYVYSIRGSAPTAIFHIRDMNWQPQ